MCVNTCRTRSCSRGACGQPPSSSHSFGFSSVLLCGLPSLRQVLSSFGAHSWLSVDIQHVGGASSRNRLRRVFSDASAGLPADSARHSWSRSLPAELSHSFADSALPSATVSSARSRTSSALHPASVFAEVELEPFRPELVHAQDTFFRASDSEHSMSVELILNLQVQIQTREQMCSSCRCMMFSKYYRHAETSHMM